MRRGGDGSDLRWFKGPERCATHTMGTFSDGDRGSTSTWTWASKNQFPFFPNLDGAPFDPIGAQGHVTRLSVDLATTSRPGYEMEMLYPHNGVLSRQDDRYHTVPYGVGLHADGSTSERPISTSSRRAPCDAAQLLDAVRSRARRRATSYFAGPDSSVQECCFVPRNERARPRATVT
mgnify:CR=1 FL=1